MPLQIRRAEKRQLKARIAIDGPTGAGKTYTALVAATVLAQGQRIVLIDSEHRRSELYADKFTFDVIQLDGPFSPQVYMEAIHLAEQEGAEVIVVDSLSHAWEGEGGALDMVDAAAKRSKSGNSFTAWKDVTPIQRQLIETLVRSPKHIIVCMRSKMEYVMQQDDRSHTNVEKIGLAPIQRAGVEFDFDLVLDMDVKHNMVASKSRCYDLADVVLNKPGPEFFQKFLAWLNSGAPEDRPLPLASPPPPATTPQTNGNGGNGRAKSAPIVLRPWPGDILVGKLRAFALKNEDQAPEMTAEGIRSLGNDLMDVCGGLLEAIQFVDFLWPGSGETDANFEPLERVPRPQLYALDTWLRTDAAGGYKPTYTRQVATAITAQEAAAVLALVLASEPAPVVAETAL